MELNGRWTAAFGSPPMANFHFIGAILIGLDIFVGSVAVVAPAAQRWRWRRRGRPSGRARATQKNIYGRFPSNICQLSIKSSQIPSDSLTDSIRRFKFRPFFFFVFLFGPFPSDLAPIRPPFGRHLAAIFHFI